MGTKNNKWFTLNGLLQSDLGMKIQWLLWSRFALFIVIFIAMLFSKVSDSFVYYLFFVYGATNLIYYIVFFYWERNWIKFSFPFICSLPLAIEIMIELVLIHNTGGAESQFLILLALTIITGAFIYSLTGTLIVTSAASISLSLLVLAEYKAMIPFNTSLPFVASLYSDGDVLFFSVYIYICFLYIIAFLAGYLSRKMDLQIKKIQKLGSQISDLKLSTAEIIENLINGIIIIGKNNEIIYFNHIAQEILDVNYPQGLSQSIIDFLPERLSLIGKNLNRYFETNKKSLRKELILEKEDGESVNVKLSVTNLTIRKTQFGTLLVIEDITLEKRRQRMMDEMEKLAAIGDISARFAHEIRNPLASIRGSVEMLMGNQNLPPEDQRLFELVIRESDRLTNFLEDFLVFARIREIPREQFVTDHIDMSRFFDELLLFCSNHPAYHKGIVIENYIKNGDIVVLGQEEQLTKAFTNIIINAFQAIGESDGKITIRAGDDREDLFSEEKLVGIVITDTGKGMSTYEVDNIFTPFVSNRKFGVGLGMAITHSVITKHKGYIEVSSVQGEGTEFRIFLSNGKYSKIMN